MIPPTFVYYLFDFNRCGIWLVPVLFHISIHENMQTLTRQHIFKSICLLSSSERISFTLWSSCVEVVWCIYNTYVYYFALFSRPLLFASNSISIVMHLGSSFFFSCKQWCFVTWDKNYVTTLKIYIHAHAHAENTTGRQTKDHIVLKWNWKILFMCYCVCVRSFERRKKKRHEVASCHACIQTCKTLHAVLSESLARSLSNKMCSTQFSKIELKCGKVTIYRENM